MLLKSEPLCAYSCTINLPEKSVANAYQEFNSDSVERCSLTGPAALILPALSGAVDPNAQKHTFRWV